jgi:hypothetical protein
MILTSNTSAFIEAQQYSKFVLENLHTVLLPQSFTRDVSDFGTGTTLNIKTVGTATLQEVTEDTPLIYSPIETDTVTLSITDYVGDAHYISDVMRMDGSQIDYILSARAKETVRQIAQNYETRFLAACNAAQIAGDPNAINGHSHRFLASGTNEQMTENDLIAMRLAFDKANVPQAGRIAIVDPVTAATFSKLITIVRSVDHSRNMIFQDLLEGGFANEHQFVMDLHGWKIFTSNLLPDVAASTDIDGTDSITAAGKANIFMSILDDNTKPIMSAWRQQPKTETERNKDRQRDEFVTTARWGLGSQRKDTIGVIVTDAVATDAS